MKLYVWENVLRDHTSGMAVVLAKNEQQAREVMVRKFPSHIVEQLPFAKCKVILTPDAFYVYGGG